MWSLQSILPSIRQSDRKTPDLFSSHSRNVRLRRSRASVASSSAEDPYAGVGSQKVGSGAQMHRRRCREQKHNSRQPFEVI